MAAISREKTLLIGVVLLGLTGLAVLQFGKRTNTRNGEDRVMVQTQSKSGAADAQTAAPIQKISGKLWRVDHYPEAGQPFRFKLEKFSPGAVYELQFNDGSRKPFSDAGTLQHIFASHGDNRVRLFAKYEGQEIVLDSLSFVVAARTPKKEKVGTAIDL